MDAIDGELIRGPATVYVGGKMLGKLKSMSATVDRRTDEELRETAYWHQARRDAAFTMGVPLRLTEMGEDYALAFLGSLPKPVAPALTAPREDRIDLYGFNLFRMSLRYTVTTTEALRRPSWLHPIARTLWVHRYGPQRPEVIPSGAAHRMLQRPSWLHPIKRTLWVHVHGPHVPEVKEVIRVSSATMRTMAVLKGVTA